MWWGGFTRGGVGWSGVVWTVDVGWTDVDVPGIDCWADLGWETPELRRKCKSSGVVSLLLGCSLCSGDKSEDSESIWIISSSDLVLKGFLKSTCDWCRAARFLGSELALKGDLKIVENLILGNSLSILLGFSAISGGFGSGKALVWIFLGATMLCFSNLANKKSFNQVWQSF